MGEEQLRQVVPCAWCSEVELYGGCGGGEGWGGGWADYVEPGLGLSVGSGVGKGGCCRCMEYDDVQMSSIWRMGKDTHVHYIHHIHHTHHTYTKYTHLSSHRSASSMVPAHG